MLTTQFFLFIPNNRECFWTTCVHSNPQSWLTEHVNVFSRATTVLLPHTWLCWGWFNESAPGLFLWKQIYECSSVFAVQGASPWRSDYNSTYVSAETRTHHGKCQQHLIHRYLTVGVCVCMWGSRRYWRAPKRATWQIKQLMPQKTACS